jgi:decaprenyl-phosphate phosphoribosyltransferase
MKYFKLLSKLLRTKQWLKNILILAAPIGGGIQLSFANAKVASLGLITFSLSASAIYVINDYHDRNIDRSNPLKKNRPFASGDVSANLAFPLSIFLFSAALFVGKNLGGDAILTLASYVVLNILYTFKLKYTPVIEMGVVASGYALRILFGAQIFSLIASGWLMISAFSVAFGIVAAKRRAEFIEINRPEHTKRIVLTFYSESSLQSISTLSFATAFTTYSLWLFEHSANLQILPLFCEIMALVLFAYLLIESERGTLESPEDLVHSLNFMTLFSVFACLNIILLQT